MGEFSDLYRNNIIKKILKFLGPIDLTSFSAVDKKAYNTASKNSRWKPFINIGWQSVQSKPGDFKRFFSQQLSSRNPLYLTCDKKGKIYSELLSKLQPAIEKEELPKYDAVVLLQLLELHLNDITEDQQFDFLLLCQCMKLVRDDGLKSIFEYYYSEQSQPIKTLGLSINKLMDLTNKYGAMKAQFFLECVTVAAPLLTDKLLSIDKLIDLMQIADNQKICIIIFSLLLTYNLRRVLLNKNKKYAAVTVDKYLADYVIDICNKVHYSIDKLLEHATDKPFPGSLYELAKKIIITWFMGRYGKIPKGLTKFIDKFDHEEALYLFVALVKLSHLPTFKFKHFNKLIQHAFAEGGNNIALIVNEIVKISYWLDDKKFNLSFVLDFVNKLGCSDFNELIQLILSINKMVIAQHLLPNELFKHYQRLGLTRTRWFCKFLQTIYPIYKNDHLIIKYLIKIITADIYEKENVKMVQEELAKALEALKPICNKLFISLHELLKVFAGHATYGSLFVYENFTCLTYLKEVISSLKDIQELYESGIINAEELNVYIHKNHPQRTASLFNLLKTFKHLIKDKVVDAAYILKTKSITILFVLPNHCGDYEVILRAGFISLQQIEFLFDQNCRNQSRDTCGYQVLKNIFDNLTILKSLILDGKIDFNHLWYYIEKHTIYETDNLLNSLVQAKHLIESSILPANSVIDFDWNKLGYTFNQAIDFFKFLTLRTNSIYSMDNINQLQRHVKSSFYPVYQTFVKKASELGVDRLTDQDVVHIVFGYDSLAIKKHLSSNSKPAKTKWKFFTKTSFNKEKIEIAKSLNVDTKNSIECGISSKTSLSN